VRPGAAGESVGVTDHVHDDARRGANDETPASLGVGRVDIVAV